MEDVIEDYFKFREDQYEDDDELILAMSELRQRRIDLKMSFDEFDSVWMLEKMRKRRKIENFELQSLRNEVKEGGVYVIENFKAREKQCHLRQCIQIICQEPTTQMKK